MHRDSNCANQAEDILAGLGPDPKAYSGFLVRLVKRGDIIQIGDSIIVINEVKDGRAKIAIRAKRHTLIQTYPTTPER